MVVKKTVRPWLNVGGKMSENPNGSLYTTGADDGDGKADDGGGVCCLCTVQYSTSCVYCATRVTACGTWRAATAG